MIAPLLVIATLVGFVLGHQAADTEHAAQRKWMTDHECHWVQVQPDWISCNQPTPVIYKVLSND